MKEQVMKTAEALHMGTDTDSLSAPSIFGNTAFETPLAMDGDTSTHDAAPQQVSKKGELGVGGDVASRAQDATETQDNIMGQGAATRGENDVANNIEPTPVRIPYNNGYGDFFFGCLPKWKKPKITKDMSEDQKLDLMGITGSNGIPVVELGNFQRFGTFPYDKLPFEIREKIIRILLQPVISSDNDQNKGIEYTRFQLEFLPDPFYHHYMFCSTKWSSVLCEEAAERLWKTECYPGRENLYLLTLNPVRTQYHSGPSKDWVFLGWLRRVSHVSASFRHELCKVLWAHTIVDTEGYEEPEDDCEIYRNYREGKENTILRDFKTFLTERPAILRGIKGFSIELSISRPQNLNKYDKFFEWCDYIADKLELKSAWFKIALSERDLQEYVHGKEDGLHDLAATSRLRVSDYFGLELSRLYDENDSSVDDWDEPLDPKYQTALLAVMKPFSLRSQVKDPTTEEGKYLQARVEEFGETDKVEETRETEELKSTKADVEIEENQ